MQIQDYFLVNSEKLDRALNGSQQENSDRVGGVGEGAYFEGGEWKKEGEVLGKKEVEVLETKLLAEYDKLGGLIQKKNKVGGVDKVKTGSFYDFKGKKIHTEPKVVLQFMINGRLVEMKADEPVPPIVEAARQMEAEENEDEDKPKKGKKKII